MHLSFSAVNENADENENGHSFVAENDSQIILVFFPFLFHTFSHQVSPTMRRQYLVQFRFFTGGPC